MEGFVDIHTHILPGVDDGAQDLSQSLELLRRAYGQGTRALVLTPHYRGRYRNNVAPKLSKLFEELSLKAKQAYPELQLYLGCEVGYELDVGEKLAEGTVLSMNGALGVPVGKLPFPDPGWGAGGAELWLCPHHRPCGAL